SDLDPLRALPKERVDFGWLYVTKWPILFKAYAAFKARNQAGLPYGDFTEFCESHRHWLEPYALFLALKDFHHGHPWWTWPEEVRFFAKARVANLPPEVQDRAAAHSFFQYIFFGQWQEVRAAAHDHNVEIIGDTPIFVAIDSADAWSNPQLFQLDQGT